ncbi:MAG: Hint domain-containing protein [Paracoccaceae bacterium]|nr:Hint domain-containing protein [Paracoccaceae bacterium]
MAQLIDMDFNDPPGSTTASDTAGTMAYDGTMQNGATTDGAGNLVLDGLNDFVEIAPAPELGLSQGTVVIDFTRLSDSSDKTLFSVDSQGYDGGGHLTIAILANGTVQVRHQTESTTHFYSGGSNTVGEPSTLAYSWGPGGSVLTVDGVVVNTGTLPLVMAGDVEPIVLGGSQDWSGDGVADDVRGEFNGEISRFQLFDEPMGAGGTIPCFAGSARIATPSGEVRADALRTGDLVLTRDNGPQALRDVIVTPVSAPEMAANPRLRPVLIPAGRLGATRDLLLSRQHAVLMDIGGGACLVRAAHLERHYRHGVRIARGTRAMTYVHLLMQRHEIVFANGVPCETLFLGDLVRRAHPCAPWAQAGMTRAYPLARNAWSARHLPAHARAGTLAPAG